MLKAKIDRELPYTLTIKKALAFTEETNQKAVY